MESTQEMLNEWRPLMCIYDVSMEKAISYFELFLPTRMSAEEHEQGGYKLVEAFI